MRSVSESSTSGGSSCVRVRPWPAKPGVELGHRAGGALQAVDRWRRVRAAPGTARTRAPCGVLLGLQDLALERAQLVGDVALGVLGGLLAHELRRQRHLAVRVRDLDVVAEHLVEPDLQARDAGALDEFLLVARQPLGAVARERAQLVEFGVEAGADQAAFLERVRRFVDERCRDRRAQVGQWIEGAREPRSNRRTAGRAVVGEALAGVRGSVAGRPDRGRWRGRTRRATSRRSRSSTCASWPVTSERSSPSACSSAIASWRPGSRRPATAAPAASCAGCARPSACRCGRGSAAATCPRRRASSARARGSAAWRGRGACTNRRARLRCRAGAAARRAASPAGR
jgi:hypothetical protein